MTEHQRQEVTVTEGVMIGTLAYHCACGYLSFDPADWHWRDKATISGQEIAERYGPYHPDFSMTAQQHDEWWATVMAKAQRDIISKLGLPPELLTPDGDWNRAAGEWQPTPRPRPEPVRPVRRKNGKGKRR